MSESVYFEEAVDQKYLQVVADVLSHSVTGELIGMRNFAMMVGLTSDQEEQNDFLDHALSEKGHAVTFQKIADDLGIELIVNTDAPYWKKIKDYFDTYVAQKDLVACILVQELILESMAVGMYLEVGDRLEGKIGEIYKLIGEDEKSHLNHSVSELRELYQADPDGFTAKVKKVHDEVMVALAAMLTKVDSEGHCEICQGSCVKENMSIANLSLSQMRGATMQNYLNILDGIGLPGDVTLQWVANLPM